MRTILSREFNLLSSFFLPSFHATDWVWNFPPEACVKDLVLSLALVEGRGLVGSFR
jgi:hypothetical protein